MLCARCLAMSFHLSKARPDGQFMNAQPSAPRGPLHFRGDWHPIGTPGIRVHTGLLIVRAAEFEMLVVETIAKIRLAYFSRKMTIKSGRSNPSRRLGLGAIGLIPCFWRMTASRRASG